jgi:hypothetical protein
MRRSFQMIYFIFYYIIKLIYRSLKYGVKWFSRIFKVFSQSAKVSIRLIYRSLKYGVKWFSRIFKVFSQSAKI